jgi:putative membrane protein insertion efficiency factor
MTVISDLGSRALLSTVRLYQRYISPQLSPACRFEPTCSEYAIGALKIYRPMPALRKICGRLLRCRPGGDSGYDPIV